MFIMAGMLHYGDMRELGTTHGSNSVWLPPVLG
jgi:hypothetical protein